MIKQQYNPVNVVPDKDPKRVDVSELIDALNMRVGTSNPLGGSGVYKIAGNAIITNPLLPITGTNKAVGWCADRVNKRLYFANWNSVDANDTIYEYSNANGFRIVLRMDLGFSSSTLLSMDYNAGYLVWTSSDIEEPRQVDIQRGINTFLPVPVDPRYQLPIEDWQIFQLHRPPATKLRVFPNPVPATSLSNPSVVGYVAETSPKPVTDVSDQGYQFAYNYEYINNIESRLSDPTEMVWNNGVYLLVPVLEFISYMTVTGGAPNTYIVATRWYFRIGNTGDWTYFRRIKNLTTEWITPAGLGSPTAGLLLGDLADLNAIGTPSIASLLGADGVPRRAEDLLFADSRLVLAGLTSGMDITLPSATVSVAYDNTVSLATRKYRTFAPFKNKQAFALEFYDDLGRTIGSKDLGAFTITPDPDSYYLLDLQTVIDTGISFNDLNLLPWNQLVDYLYDNTPFSQSVAYSRVDLENQARVVITPPVAAIDPRIETVKLIAKTHQSAVSYLRTLARPLFVYKDQNGNISFFVSNQSLNFTKDGINYNYYGIAFFFNSGEPINFSSEQNYYIEIKGQPYFNFFSAGLILKNGKPYKVINQLGSSLICEIPFIDLFEFGGGLYVSNFGNLPYEHFIWDVVLYSKLSTSSNQYNVVPVVTWTRSQFEAGAARTYYGDAYVCGDRKDYGVISISTPQFTNPYIVSQFPYWQGFWSSMNMNGIFQETWDSDIGGVVVLDLEPQEQVLSSSIRHSEQALAGTKINNIFTFDPLNQTNTQSQLGSIVKMVLLAVTNNSGNNIYVWCKSGVEMIYLGRTQQTGTDGDSVMSLSTNVFGSHNVLKGDYGIGKKTQAVMTNKGIAFGFDVVKNILVQLSNNGLDPVSDQKYFKSHALDLGVNSIIGYDPFFREVLVKDNIEGIAYNFESDFFQGRRSYNLDNELFAWLTDNQNTSQLFSLLDGELYEFNTGIQIHGQDFTSMVTSVLNIQPELNKELFSVKYSGSAGWKAIITNLKGQLSTIQIAHFQSTNGVFDGSVKRDENSTGGLISGERMEDVVQFISLQDEDSTPKQIVSIEASFIIAQTNLK
jgi:hypothetical protein